jgi:hypothetical protein
MTINNPVAFCAGLWDWGILNGCFGDTMIKPTDVDGEVERHGLFLRFETKAPGANIPVGQDIMFRRLAKTGIFTVFVIWGNTNSPEEIQIYGKRGVHPKETCDLDKFRERVATWFDYADKHQ